MRVAAGLALALCIALAAALPAAAQAPAELLAVHARAETGDRDALFELARHFEDGRGVPQSFARAHALYVMAGERGHPEAAAAAARLDGRLTAEQRRQSGGVLAAWQTVRGQWPRPPEAGAAGEPGHRLGGLGQQAEQCFDRVLKSEPIEARVARIGNARLKEQVAKFWAGRPTCAPSPEALVNAFQCIQSGAAEISQGYGEIRGQLAVNADRSREEFCAFAKPLTEGRTYTDLEEVDKRVDSFDAKARELNACAVRFREWNQASAPGRIGTLVHELSTELQENLDKLVSLQAEFGQIRVNITDTKRNVTAAVARAINVCQ